MRLDYAMGACKMPSDPKLENAPIVRRTNCRIGMHAFTYTDKPGFCDCGAYDYDTWVRVLREQGP